MTQLLKELLDRVQKLERANKENFQEIRSEVRGDLADMKKRLVSMEATTTTVLAKTTNVLDIIHLDCYSVLESL